MSWDDPNANPLQDIQDVARRQARPQVKNTLVIPKWALNYCSEEQIQRAYDELGLDQAFAGWTTW